MNDNGSCHCGAIACDIEGDLAALPVKHFDGKSL